LAKRKRVFPVKVWEDLILARVHPYRHSFGKMQTCVKFSEKQYGHTHTLYIWPGVASLSLGITEQWRVSSLRGDDPTTGPLTTSF